MFYEFYGFKDIKNPKKKEKFLVNIKEIMRVEIFKPDHRDFVIFRLRRSELDFMIEVGSAELFMQQFRKESEKWN